MATNLPNSTNNRPNKQEPAYQKKSPSQSEQLQQRVKDKAGEALKKR